ncbi:MAG: DUF4954 family protein [Ignavibacteriales bacterium]
MNLRGLSETEIVKMINNGCSSEDWSRIQVSPCFDTGRIINVSFSGDIILGACSKKVVLLGGAEKPSGIYNSTVHNCSFEDNVYVSNVNMLANYDVEKEVVIENTSTVVTDGENSFGNGTVLEILNEGGGRSLKIFDRLSVQMAYMLVLYRHNRHLISRLEKMIDDYVVLIRSGRGRINQGSRIQNCQVLRNIRAGEYALIQGAARLENGSILSCREDPSYVGTGVTASDFIFQAGSKIDGFAILDKCFVGQGVRIGKQYSAENSAFFANCEAFHGEACSVFAGPYTVTHHKSSLLIAGLFSFFNAGSGTNQSNHMYKLGPVHQGILERGSKTGSFSYLMWPCRVGAFTAIIGKHYRNFDTTDFPFSYISEEEGKSVLTPAMNLFTVGTRRDAEKWPARDRRKSPEKLDLINFEMLSPYTVGKMKTAAEILQAYYQRTPREQDFISYKGIEINRLMLRTGAKYYEMGIRIFMGRCVVARLEKTAGVRGFDEIRRLLIPAQKEERLSEWVDMGGLLLPSEEARNLAEMIASGKINNIIELEEKLRTIWDNYPLSEFGWCVRLIEEKYSTKIEDISKDQLIKIIDDWRTDTVKLNNMILKDALREFDPSSRIGFGIDGDQEESDQDFLAVRGDYEMNKFIKHLKADNASVEWKASELLAQIKSDKEHAKVSP